MTHGFDRDYWQSHWERRPEPEAERGIGIPNPYLPRETADLVPGTALDAGCGEGAEAVWLAGAGWQVTAADISATALAGASALAATSRVAAGSVQWVEADLTSWEPGRLFDLVTTHYAHPSMPQLAFYRRISQWVAPGGTLLIVGHLHVENAAQHAESGAGPGGRGRHEEHGHREQHTHRDQHGHPPEEASVTASGVVEVLDGRQWSVVTAEERVRTTSERAGPSVRLPDVVVRAVRRQ